MWYRPSRCSVESPVPITRNFILRLILISVPSSTITSVPTWASVWVFLYSTGFREWPACVRQKTITALLVNNMNRRKKNCRNWCFRPYRTGKATWREHTDGKEVSSDSLAYHVTRRKYEEVDDLTRCTEQCSYLAGSETLLLQSKLTYLMKCRLVDYYKGEEIIRGFEAADK